MAGAFTRSASTKYGLRGADPYASGGGGWDDSSRRGQGVGSGISGYFGSTKSGMSASGTRGGGKGAARSAAAARRQHAGAETRAELEALPDEVLEAIAMEERYLEPDHGDAQHGDADSVNDPDALHDAAEAVLDLAGENERSKNEASERNVILMLGKS